MGALKRIYGFDLVVDIRMQDDNSLLLGLGDVHEVVSAIVMKKMETSS